MSLLLLLLAAPSHGEAGIRAQAVTARNRACNLKGGKKQPLVDWLIVGTDWQLL